MIWLRVGSIASSIEIGNNRRSKAEGAGQEIYFFGAKNVTLEDFTNFENLDFKDKGRENLTNLGLGLVTFFPL